jgi:hypothetical protein
MESYPGSPQDPGFAAVRRRSPAWPVAGATPVETTGGERT